MEIANVIFGFLIKIPQKNKWIFKVNILKTIYSQNGLSVLKRKN